MREIALHLLDIVENSVAAQAHTIQVNIWEDLAADTLIASVQDDGKGMDSETVKRVVDPFVTSRTTRKVGLGIPLLKAAAEMCNGSLQITSTPGKGTLLEVKFQRSHIDRMPLGDLSGTFLSLLIAHPEIHWLFTYIVRITNSNPAEEFIFDDQPIKETLGDLPLTEPDVLAYLRTSIQEGVAQVQQVIQQNEISTLKSVNSWKTSA